MPSFGALLHGYPNRHGEAALLHGSKKVPYVIPAKAGIQKSI
ncbi:MULTISPECIES: hypothetical protein [unclassified Rickettsia]